MMGDATDPEIIIQPVQGSGEPHPEKANENSHQTEGTSNLTERDLKKATTVNAEQEREKNQNNITDSKEDSGKDVGNVSQPAVTSTGTEENPNTADDTKSEIKENPDGSLHVDKPVSDSVSSTQVTMTSVSPTNKEESTKGESDEVPSKLPSTPQLEEAARMVSISWENDNASISLKTYLSHNAGQCFHITLPSLTTQEKEWKSTVDTASIVIIFYCFPKPQKPIEDMTPYLKYCVDKNGPEKVIVVMGNIEKSEGEMRSDWEKSPFSKCDLLLFTKAELDRMKETLLLQSMAEKIRKLKAFQATGSEEAPTANGVPSEIRTSQDNHNKAIFVTLTKSLKEHSKWLQKQLSQKIKYYEKSVSCFFTNSIPKFTHCILYFTGESFLKFTEKEDSFMDILDKIETKKVMVTIVLSSEISEKQIRERYAKSRIRERNLLVFSKEEINVKDTKPQTTDLKMEEKRGEFQNIIQSKGTAKMGEIEKPPSNPTNLRTIGIFSRDAASNYTWMENKLRSADLHHDIKDVTAFYISNKGLAPFYEDVARCTFGILYHTKNRGRVNVTDVTDSLYDSELEYMSLILGRNNVIVVIDDLEDSSVREKERILGTQPSIRKYANNLLLVSEEEKTKENKTPHLKKKLREALMSTYKDHEGTNPDPQPIDLQIEKNTKL